MNDLPPVAVVLIVIDKSGAVIRMDDGDQIPNIVVDVGSDVVVRVGQRGGLAEDVIGGLGFGYDIAGGAEIELLGDLGLGSVISSAGQQLARRPIVVRVLD